MKKITAIIAIVTLSIAFSATASAQVSASAPTSATVVTPISILKTTNMSFGNVAVSSLGGTVVLPATGTRTTTGGVTLPATNGTVTAAQFTVSGQADYTYAITLPTTLTITKAVTNETMLVNAFTTPAATGTLTGGTQAFFVGATLNVSALQVAGLYENTTGFAVTVNYN